MTYTTPVQNLLKQSKNNPNKVYLHQPIERQWQKYTWTEVEHQARCIAKGLQSQGYEKGSRIGILSKNCAHWIISDNDGWLYTCSHFFNCASQHDKLCN
jgi:long-subunit acyl-CoA synthetase (AMP-forming)